MIAIKTVYKGPTNTKGSRIIASANGHRVTIGYPHELSGEAVYKLAAIKLCEKMGWSTELVGGCLDNGSHVFVFSKQ